MPRSIATSTATSAASSRYPSRASSPKPRQVFRFFDLPSELRLRIYEQVLLVQKPLDLDPMNYRLVLPRLSLFLVSRRMHNEAYPVFYGQTIRIFPHHDHGRFFHTKKPLLARLPPHYRSAIVSMELRLGPGWSKPPKCQNAGDALGLRDCTSLRVLKILVEIDPSEAVFNGFRGKNATEDTYKLFCVDLLSQIVEQVPSLETVELDAYPGVRKEAPLVMALRRTTNKSGKRFVWGPQRGWEKDSDEPGSIGLENVMAGMGISDAPRIVEVEA